MTDSHNGSNNKQKDNNNRTTTLERTAALVTRGVNAFYWYMYQVFALDSAVVEIQKCSARMVAFKLMQCIIVEKPSNQVNT